MWPAWSHENAFLILNSRLNTAGVSLLLLLAQACDARVLTRGLAQFNCAATGPPYSHTSQDFIQL